MYTNRRKIELGERGITGWPEREMPFQQQQDGSSCGPLLMLVSKTGYHQQMMKVITNLNLTETNIF